MDFWYLGTGPNSPWLADSLEDRTYIQYWCYGILGLANIFIFARAYTRIVSPKKIGPDDIFALAAWLGELVLAVTIWEAFHHGLGFRAIHLLRQDDSYLIILALSKWTWIIHVLLAAISSLIKANIVCLYRRFTSTTRQCAALNIILAATLAYGVGSVLVISILCGPYHRRNLTELSEEPELKDLPAGANPRCGKLFNVSIFNAVWQITTDLILAIAPAFVLKDLRMDRRNRIFLTIMFSFGMLVMVGTIGRQVTIFNIDVAIQDPFWPVATEIPWAVVEISLSTIFLCLPPLAPYFSKILSRWDFETIEGSRLDNGHLPETIGSAPISSRAAARRSPYNDHSLLNDTMTMERTQFASPAPSIRLCTNSDLDEKANLDVELAIPEPTITRESDGIAAQEKMDLNRTGTSYLPGVKKSVVLHESRGESSDNIELGAQVTTESL